MSESRTGPTGLRLTVNLSAKSVVALDALVATDNATNKTDAINQALQFYGEIKSLMARGGALYIREPGETEMARVKIF